MSLLGCCSSWGLTRHTCVCISISMANTLKPGLGITRSDPACTVHSSFLPSLVHSRRLSVSEQPQHSHLLDRGLCLPVPDAPPPCSGSDTSRRATAPLPCPMETLLTLCGLQTGGEAAVLSNPLLRHRASGIPRWTRWLPPPSVADALAGPSLIVSGSFRKSCRSPSPWWPSPRPM